MFISEKETRELHETQVQSMASRITAQKNDSTQISRCLKMNEGHAGMDAHGKIDLGKLQMNKPAQSTYVEENQEAVSVDDGQVSKGTVKINMQAPADAGSNQGTRPTKSNPFAKTTTDLNKKNTVAPNGTDSVDVLKSSSTMNGTGQQ